MVSSKSGTLETVLKFIGAQPEINAHQKDPSALQREWDKIRYRIGAISYRGEPWLREPLNWDAIKTGIYDWFKGYSR